MHQTIDWLLKAAWKHTTVGKGIQNKNLITQIKTMFFLPLGLLLFLLHSQNQKQELKNNHHFSYCQCVEKQERKPKRTGEEEEKDSTGRCKCCCCCPSWVGMGGWRVCWGEDGLVRWGSRPSGPDRLPTTTISSALPSMDSYPRQSSWLQTSTSRPVAPPGSRFLWRRSIRKCSVGTLGKRPTKKQNTLINNSYHIHSARFRLFRTLILTAKTSTYKMTKCSDIDRPMAPINQGLVHGGIVTNDWFSDRLQKTNNVIST